MRERIILHLDMDAFFASVEQRVNPKLRGQAVIVASHYETRPVVCTASYQARNYGIKTGMPLNKARRLCPQATVVLADTEKYLSTSKKIFNKLSEYSPSVEIFSIDEAFLDITDT